MIFFLRSRKQGQILRQEVIGILSEMSGNSEDIAEFLRHERVTGTRCKIGDCPLGNYLIRRLQPNWDPVYVDVSRHEIVVTSKRRPFSSTKIEIGRTALSVFVDMFDRCQFPALDVEGRKMNSAEYAQTLNPQPARAPQLVG